MKYYINRKFITMKQVLVLFDDYKPLTEHVRAILRTKDGTAYKHTIHGLSKVMASHIITGESFKGTCWDMMMPWEHSDRQALEVITNDIFIKLNALKNASPSLQSSVLYGNKHILELILNEINPNNAIHNGEVYYRAN